MHRISRDRYARKRQVGVREQGQTPAVPGNRDLRIAVTNGGHAMRRAWGSCAVLVVTVLGLIIASSAGGVRAGRP
jgi:hypothetical protein